MAYSKSIPPIKATGFTVEELRQHLRYDPDTGDFWCLVPGGNRRRTDQPAGTVRDFCKEPWKVVRLIGIGGKQYLANRLAAMDGLLLAGVVEAIEGGLAVSNG